MMGCDIHITIEQRKDGQWERVHWYNSTRNSWEKWDHPPDVMGAVKVPENFKRRCYSLFGVLAGVRSNLLPCIAEPKGLPKDLSFPADDHDNYVGDHSFSWLTLQELEEYPLDQPCFLSFYAYADDYPIQKPIRNMAVGEWFEEVLPVLRTLGEPDDVRIVFGFDN